MSKRQNRPSVFDLPVPSPAQPEPAAPALSVVPSAPAPATRAVKSSLYLSPEVYDRLREIAFTERVKLHELFIEGINAVLEKRAYAPVSAKK